MAKNKVVTCGFCSVFCGNDWCSYGGDMEKFYKVVDNKLLSATLFTNEDGVQSVRFKDNTVLNFFDRAEALVYIDLKGFKSYEKSKAG